MGNLARNMILRLIGVQFYGCAQLSEHFYVYQGDRLIIGEGVCLGSFCKIWDFHDVVLGARLLASHNLTIVAGTHDPITLEPIVAPVRIGEDCWIGANVTIIGPVKIGRGVIIGAGAVVVSDLPEHTICVGVPARPIKKRSCD